MELHRHDFALRVWALVAVVAGSGFILFGDAVLTAAGVLLVIGGLMSLMGVVHNAMVTERY
jgi:hypothetical protein